MQIFAVVLVLGMVAAACSSNGGSSASSSASGSGAAVQSGGTLKLAMLSDVDAAFDPQKSYYSVTWEYYRCCLLRTLMSYKGVPTDEGGANIYPDLAASDPQVSADGLTWTFQLQQGLMYAPPFQDTEITSGDIVRALEREANPKANVGGYSFYYSVIKGFDDFAKGKAKSISGLSTPDDHTLAVTVTAPTGDLGYRFAMAATAPIPPNGGAALGAADGHDTNYGRFLVASGPYMIQGADQMDFSVPAAKQKPASGYVPSRSIVLVRNPSWSASTDNLRKAYADKIEVSEGGDNNDLYNQVNAGSLDLVVDGVAPANDIKKYASDPSLQQYLHVDPSDAVRYISFNLAIPPFDDIHVRKAVSFALDKAGFRQLRGGETTGEIAGHIMVNSLENNLLQNYDPYKTTNEAGDITKAMDEMKQSKYDTNQDGKCDASVCSKILTMTDNQDPYPKQAALLSQNLAPLGLTLDVKQLERTTMYNKCNDANSHTALCAGPAWGKDYADGYTFAGPLFDSSSNWPSCCNYSLLGASAKDLTGWGYDITTMPSVDDKIAECSAATGGARFQCWADLDKNLMENVVPWVPYLFDNNVAITSSNVTHSSFDQFAGLTAFDQMALKS
jgi:peptide/nickel transport system substrate-binding protein